ncbi:hypothetical protein C8P64_1991 [Christiangramia gaetbulicola]|uniref:Uncharacterized protein n=1 Tax=Christiangramia gaetbulicola TaxID=703340 RepID=A0A2T6AI16_9FLAO|nr:DMT family transporter [Christiangramia gaetbulicola]PTX43463.1 hypothetical protein C8P64_1991 [Christiangramia gaetbulicola]
MTIKDVKYKKSFQNDHKLSKLLNQFESLINELKKKKLTENLVLFINSQIEEVNSIEDSNKRLKNKIRKNQSKIIQQVEKESKIVPKNHYRNTWLALGMAVFGIPMGVAFGTILGNLAVIGIGLPIGMAIGIAIGTNKDKQALEEGRQLDFEVKY